VTRPKYGRGMVVAAHPDDSEFSVAGTVAKWTRQGTEFVYVICTDGGKGTDDPDLPPVRLTPIRHEEQRAACAVLGVKQVVFLDHEDGVLQPTLELRRDIARQIRIHQPDVIFCGDPTTRYFRGDYINHPDHRAAAEAALCAIFPDARNRWQFPELLAEGLEPYAVRDVYLMGTTIPDTWIDIEETLDVKLKALAQHRTQLDATAPGVEDWIRELAQRHAEGHGMRYAEAFKRMVLD
jgi:LmbE family N-acetylglucosaminyl deacetylase